MAVDNLQIIGNRAINEYALKAIESERKRSHLLLHNGPDDPVQRLLIVLQPGSYVRPHHHSQQWEMLVLLRGKAELLHFDQEGLLRSRGEISGDAPIAQIPRAEWHTFLVLEPDTAVMEIKPGPYQANEFADWAPPEGHRKVPSVLNWLLTARPGEIWRA
jgi:cupin fold WbuC family metalloprotein